MDLIASLAELKTSMLAEIKKSFDEVNGKLDGLQETVNTHGERLNSLEDNAETFHQRLAEMEACCERLQTDNTKLKSRLTEIRVTISITPKRRTLCNISINYYGVHRTLVYSHL